MDSLFRAIRSPIAAEWVSTSAVVVVSAVVGDYAREGMNLVQWAGGVAAILGSIGWAVMVRTWRRTT
jgi:hypothetical protein